MDPEKSSNVNLAPDTTTAQSASGVTTPDLIAEEKIHQQINPQAEGHLAAEDDTIIEEYPTGRRLAPIILALVCAVFLIAIDMTIIGTAIPKITDEFHGLNMVSWYGSVYFMTFGGFQPASGKFFKYFPLKISFLGAIGIFMLGSLICAVAQNSVTFVVGRAIAGVGASGVGTGAFTIVGYAAEPRLRPGFFGMIGAVYGLSSVLGPILGGVFTDRATWRWCFYLNLPVGGLSVALIWFFFKTPPQATTVKATWKEKLLQMDPIGIALVMGGIISFVLALEYGGQKKPWGSSTVIGLIVGSVLIWVAFIGWEFLNKKRAMLEGRIFFRRYVWQPAIFQFFYAAAYFVLLYYLPIYFQSIDNRTAISSGVLNLPLVLALVLGTTTSGIIVTKTGHAAPFMVIGAVLALVATGLIYTFDIGTSIGKWIGYQFFYGLSVGLGFQMGITISQGHAPMEDMSTISATNLFFQTIGGAFAISAAQSAFVNRLLTELAKTAPDINPALVIGTGATQIRHVFSAEQLPLVISAYMSGVKLTLALTIALVGAACLVVPFVPHKRLNAEARQAAGAAA